MKITPFTDIIYIKMQEVTAGVLDTSSRESAIEYVKVMGLGKGTEGGKIKVGDHLFVKAWAIDIITYDDVKYYFVNVKTGGILAIVK